MSLEIKADNTKEVLSELEKAIVNGLTAIGMTADLNSALRQRKNGQRLLSIFLLVEISGIEPLTS